jgi:hypothetical protein
MVRAVYTILGCLLFSMSSYAAPTKLECQSSTNNFESNLSELEKVAEEVECNASLTEDQIVGICDSIYNKKPSLAGSLFSQQFEEDLWALSCVKADQKILDNPEALKEAHRKIQAMWNSNRKSMQCKGFPLRNANITNFSVNSGFTTFLRSAVKVYKLDMNFKNENQQTVMDYLVEQIDSYKRANMTTKVNELEKIYKVLGDAGAKHAKDLPRD